MLGATLGEGPAVVLVAFLPAFITITIICGLLSIGKLKKIRKLLPILALMIVIVVYMALITRLGGSNMDFGIILALNAAAAFMLSLLMVLFSKG
jgi:predicted neutral ceramidase superfamily lipid hydrolase